METGRIHRQTRALEAERFGALLGEAIANNDHEAVLYILGRIDERISFAGAYGSSDKYYVLRDVACAALDLWPTPEDAEPLPPLQAVEPSNG
jgi:hypothetical protein